MTSDQVIAVLRGQETALRRLGVSGAALFGSTARGEARPDSDLDIWVEIDPDAELDLYAYIGVIHFIQDLFDVPVDVANRDALKDHVRPSAERDAIHAF